MGLSTIAPLDIWMSASTTEVSWSQSMVIVPEWSPGVLCSKGKRGGNNDMKPGINYCI